MPELLVDQRTLVDDVGATTPHVPAVVQEMRTPTPAPGFVSTRWNVVPTRFQAATSTVMAGVVSVPATKHSAELTHETQVGVAVSPAGTGNVGLDHVCPPSVDKSTGEPPLYVARHRLALAHESVGESSP